MSSFNGGCHCMLCEIEDESHDHLFFHCRYSSKMWEILTRLGKVQWPNCNWDRMLRWAGKKFSKKKRFHNVLAKHMLATAVYFVWTERNHRTFRNQRKPANVLAHEAAMQIRLLLMSYSGHIPDHARASWNV
ncbi:reverse transcriptase zinc-binding domain-containing [Salix suchowensis]|nr:reverse transcriptase zinc-binding domain-containing [Salix suchowensis]